MQEFIGTDIVEDILRNAYLIIIVSFCLMWFSALVGVLIRKAKGEMDENAHHDMDLIVSATLTLLGLIIGFSFSMAISRYDQRKTLEEAEANAIGTEYVRADLMPAADAAKVQTLLKGYLDQRIEYYEMREGDGLARLNAATVQRQAELWRAVRSRLRQRYADHGPGRLWDERRTELAGVYAGGLVEPGSTGGVDSDGGDGPRGKCAVGYTMRQDGLEASGCWCCRWC